VSRRRRVGTVLRGMAALITLLVLVVGLPLLLVRLGGSPIPRHILGWHQLERALLRRDNGTIFLGAVRDISWIAWAAFTVAVLAEALAALRGRNAPRLGLGGLQATAGRLVALAILTFSGPAALLSVPQAVPVAAVTVQPAAPADAPPGAAVTMPDMALVPRDATLIPPDIALAAPGPAMARPAAEPPGQSSAAQSSISAAPESSARPLAGQAAAGPDPQVMSMGFYQLVTVRPGDCLWTIAHRYLGQGDLYPEIAKLNLGHDMGGGHVFTDPSMVWPGWVLQIPAASTAGPSAPHTAEPPRHGAHPSREPRFRRPHAGAGAGGRPSASPRPAVPPTPVARSASPAPSAAASAPQAAASAPQGAVGLSASGAPAAASPAPGQPAQIPALAVFAGGMLAGGAVVTLAGMRHRQRQIRRPGRRIPLPASAPVMEAEQRLRAQTLVQPATALRAALSDLGTGLLASGQPIPDITGIRLLPSGMEVLLASPAGEPPPPFTVLGGRQGMAWHLALPGDAPAEPFSPTETGDLLPGLFTAGAIDDGYLLLDLEYLRVTAVSGPPALADQFLATAAAELVTSELAGWYDLILIGCPELDAVGGRATSCETLEEALDLLAAKAVVLRRRLRETPAADILRHRLTDPGDEDWALTLLVSRIPPTSGQLALLLDLASDPAGIAALVPGTAAAPEGHTGPATIDLAADPEAHGRIVAHISPLQLQAWPQILDDAGYLALASLFATAEQDGDVAADAPPYDGSLWPSPGMLAAMVEMPQDGHDPAPEDWQQPEAGPAEAWPAEVWPAEDWQQPEAGPAENWPAEDWAAEDWQQPEPGPAENWPAENWPAEDWQAEDWQAGIWQPGDWHPNGQPLNHSQPDQLLPAGGPLAGGPPGVGQSSAGPEMPASPQVPAGPETPVGPETPLGPQEEESLRIGVLGTLTVNGTPGALLPAQSQLVLALALNGREGLSNRQLCYLLGADPDHPKPSDSLRQLIVRTRRQLGRAPDDREWIEHLGAGQYALHPQTRFDWHEFDALTREGMQARDAGRLREALRLIRGQPFTGCYHWSVDLALIETVRAQIVDAAEMLSGLELAAGDPAAGARAARTGLAGDNAAEQLWRALMRAEHAAGNMSGVREAWSRCLDVIGDIAADGEPHPETAALYRQLLESSRTPPAWSPG
jgi:DNA-binding SARP family transcriptional activator/nucleoid-associated protein YgaU